MKIKCRKISHCTVTYSHNYYMYRVKVTSIDQSNSFMWSSENVPTDKRYKSCSNIIHAAVLILQAASVGPVR